MSPHSELEQNGSPRFRRPGPNYIPETTAMEMEMIDMGIQAWSSQFPKLAVKQNKTKQKNTVIQMCEVQRLACNAYNKLLCLTRDPGAAQNNWEGECVVHNEQTGKPPFFLFRFDRCWFSSAEGTRQTVRQRTERIFGNVIMTMRWSLGVFVFVCFLLLFSPENYYGWQFMLAGGLPCILKNK